MIEAFGYRFYPAFFILVGFIIILLTVGGIFLFKFLGKKKDNDNNNAEKIKVTQYISSWQKKHLPVIIDKELSSSDSEEYSDILISAKKYIADNNLWNKDKLLAINESLILILSDLFLEESLSAFRDGDKDKAVLLIHSIDCINGTIECLNGRKEWITNDADKATNLVHMSEQEQRLMYIAFDAVSSVSALVDEKTGKIPGFSGVINDLKQFTSARFMDTKEAISECKSFTFISDYNKEVIIYSLFQSVLNIMEDVSLSYYREFEMFTFRVLACMIDNQTYDDIIATIE